MHKAVFQDDISRDFSDLIIITMLAMKRQDNYFAGGMTRSDFFFNDIAFQGSRDGHEYSISASIFAQRIENSYKKNLYI